MAHAVSSVRLPLFYPTPSTSAAAAASSPLFPSLPRRHQIVLLWRHPSSTPLLHSPSPSFCSSSSYGFVRRVSTVPVEQAPAPDFDVWEEIARLEALRSRLQAAKGLREKLRVLDADPRVSGFFGVRRKWICKVLPRIGLSEVFLLKCVVAAGQGHVLVSEMEGDGWEVRTEGSALKSAFYVLAEMVENWGSDGNGIGGANDRVGIVALNGLLKTLGEIEQFYDCIGGIVGYQIMILGLLSSSAMEGQPKSWSRHLDRSMKYEVMEFHIPNGLNLSAKTECASQAALWGIVGLPDLGEIYPLGGSGDRLGLVDSETGECLPAAMLLYCGRTLLEGLIRDLQPLVPVVAAEDGQWLISKPFSPVCKPGGHGAIWKLAHDKGIFKWFYSHGRKGATVRQVSNVVAATDLTLLALAGIGLHHGKKLGFASCQRNPGATEGVNVLVERKSSDGQWAYGMTCIEYTEFENFGIIDQPLSPSSVPGGRLECTMQNIADNFMNTYSSRRYKGVEEELNTFIVYNERRRVTSSAKKKRRQSAKSLHQTPEGSLLDIMRNASDLLSFCNIKIPKIHDNNKYLHSGPPFLILLHPALGPLWEVTRQKFHGGSIAEGSELQIEVAEFLWRDVELDGSMIIVAENPMGSTRVGADGEPILQYGYRCGRCKLQNVRVLNKGIDWSADNVYWKHDVQRFEMLKIVLHGNAEFEATNITLQVLMTVQEFLKLNHVSVKNNHLSFDI